VDLLGSGVIELGDKIDWHKDYKTGIRWKPRYMRDIDYNNLEQPSDVKYAWELSRVQWLIPLGQAYLLTSEEKYARAAREILADWIRNNPYACSVNWACTMEVALRIVSWSWLFHAFKESDSWRHEGFREAFLRTLYLHGDFTERHLERSDINGNHYTADAAGLVFAGLFFGEGKAPRRWAKMGWAILCDELPKQVFPDDVDFEDSVPYHRLVLELFLFPALYRLRHGLEVSASYRERLIAMARFTEAYSRPDGSVPIWGDADDARTLPFGGQPINDHRYLMALTGLVLEDEELLKPFGGEKAEIFWWLGADATERLQTVERSGAPPRSRAYEDGGFYIMRNDSDHVFIDCGPLGLAGRGGHGHNDALSFEAVLDGVHLITDSGAYLYTADYRVRNRFRATASHNTPMVDGEEMNRFIRPDYLWNLHNDAKAELVEWQAGRECDRLVGLHHGYSRLKAPVTPIRTIELFHPAHRLVIRDEFVGKGEHEFAIPLHLAEAVQVEKAGSSLYRLSNAGRSFHLNWSGDGAWDTRIEASELSPTYGRLIRSRQIIWCCHGRAKDVRLLVVIEPVMGTS